MSRKPSVLARFLGAIERAGNRMPDPTLIFLIGLGIVALVSRLLADHAFEVPGATGTRTLVVRNLLAGPAVAELFAGMVSTFVDFAPLGVVLVAVLGVGVAEKSGFVAAALRTLLAVTPRSLLTPVLLLVAILSHTIIDAAFVVIIPLGGVVFRAAGRHPLAGIACAFAGVSGGFAANLVPTPVDPLLQGLTEAAAGIVDPSYRVNPLCNWWFGIGSALLLLIVGWYVTDRVVEPRLARLPFGDGAAADVPAQRTTASGDERRALIVGLVTVLVCVIVLVAVTAPAASPLRAPDGRLNGRDAPLMQAIVPLLFLLFLLPGVAYGLAAGTFKSHRDVVAAMSDSMSTLGYYLVLMFFCSQFTAALYASNLGALLAVEGSAGLQRLALPAGVTVAGTVLLAAAVNLVVGSASAKWAMMAPILVPILMQAGLSPELAQAAYRVGDSTTNIVTPLMPYFPLIVVYCKRWSSDVGIGTVVALMLPYTLILIVVWPALLLLFQALGIPLGVESVYRYP